MKTKASFVTNSSSTSFVLVGRRLTPKDIAEIDKPIDSQRIYCVGPHLYEGVDVFPLDSQMIYVVKNVPREFILENLQFVDTKGGEIKYDDDYYSLDYLDGKSMKGMEVFSGSADHHSTEGVHEFLKRYVKSDWEKILFPNGE